MKQILFFAGIGLLIFITSCGCDNNHSDEKFQNVPQGTDWKYRGVDERTEDNVDEWQYDGKRSEDGIDWEYIDRARDAYESGE